MKNELIVNGQVVEYEKLKHDANGNPRYLIHFSDLLTDNEKEIIGLNVKYNLALKKARQISGKKSKAKGYEYYIAISSFNLLSDLKQII